LLCFDALAFYVNEIVPACKTGLPLYCLVSFVGKYGLFLSIVHKLYCGIEDG